MNLILVKHPAAKAIVAAVIGLIVIAIQAIQVASSDGSPWSWPKTFIVILSVLSPIAVYAQPNSAPTVPGVAPGPGND